MRADGRAGGGLGLVARYSAAITEAIDNGEAKVIAFRGLLSAFPSKNT